MTALLGTKRGMTQMWGDDGERMPVTVLEVPPNTVTALRTVEEHGYEAVQLGIGAVRPKVLNKPQLGQFAKAGIAPLRHLREVRMAAGERKVGDTLAAAELFPVGSTVDVIGITKGKGFAGTIKRHGFARGPMSHGSMNARRPGSIGMKEHPGRVLKGKRMAGRMGNERVTVKGLTVLAVDAESNRVLVRGPVPGAAGGLVLLRLSKGGK